MKKPLAVSLLIANIALFAGIAHAQSFGTFASAVSLSNCTQSNFFNTTGTAANVFGPAGNVFNNSNLGVYTQNSGSLVLRGGALKTSKTAGANVCSARLYYRVYLQSGAPGAFNSIDLAHLNDCDISTGQFPSGGACSAGDQVWETVIPDGTTVPYAPVNLTTLSPGNYVLEVYYDVSGSNTSTSGCSDLVVLNNSGSNYKAFFSIQAPNFASNNPVTCNGSDGYITITGLVAGSTYSVSYTKNGVPIAIPLNLTANGSGQIIIPNLTAGLYSNFQFQINGCTTNLFVGIVLSNPIFIPTFSLVTPFCAGTTPPPLLPTSNNGIGGSWNPPVISNQSSGSYTFTPSGGTCGLPVTMNVTVIPLVMPTFPFGTSLAICAGGSVPLLPNMSSNGISGSWSPAVVDNQHSNTYVFRPGGGGGCNDTATFTVTVTPNTVTAFDFGSSLTICAGGSVPVLPDTSTNGITGTWSPAVVDNQTSNTYHFTPTPGQCATPQSFDVTVNPIVTPVFSFGSVINACAGATMPALPDTSANGITGKWNTPTIDNQNSANYIFTADSGQCAIVSTPLTVNIAPNIAPNFSFGTSVSICAGGAVPTLPDTSTNGITGSWNPAVVDGQNSQTYVFTPNAGQCATTTSFAVTVNAIIVPTFSFGTTLTVCAGSGVPALPDTSTNGITGTWSPTTIDNQNSQAYTFTPDSGQCASGASLTVTVTPTITPVFSIGTTLSICTGGTVPALPDTSTNGIIGTWSPAVVDNQVSNSYTFTPNTSPQQCVLTAGYAVTVNPIITPTFSFGDSLSICIGATVPVLADTSTNGISGTWSPAAIDNQNSGSYKFTPDSGQCTIDSVILTVGVNEIPTVTVRSDTSLYDGSIMPVTYLTGAPANAIFNWTNSQPGIGLPASGIGNIPSFTAVNMGDNSVVATITVTPQLGGCLGPQHSYNITVIPLTKDVFVPNVFTPNGDGRNDKLYVYGNYIDKLEMRIFNQWGEQIAVINNISQGWDGTQRGKPQPVGVYVYVLKAVLTTGKVVQLKGSITLLR